MHPKSRLQSIALVVHQRKSMKVEGRWVPIPEESSQWPLTARELANQECWWWTFWVQTFALWSAKLWVFDDQSCHVQHPVRSCFGIRCSRFDASDAVWHKILNKLSMEPFNDMVDLNQLLLNISSKVNRDHGRWRWRWNYWSCPADCSIWCKVSIHQPDKKLLAELRRLSTLFKEVGRGARELYIF